MRKQINLWTNKTSSKEAYACWAQQQTNPNLRFLERNHEVTEEEEVKQSKVAWTEQQSNPGSKIGHVWTRLAQAPKRDLIKDVPRLPTLILSNV
ncbi:hypothetical protein PIB30_076352 [Stylosanthes scabra]|uniref:Uncharacterized protein n=1 Tax=Stylosanthes scabra TaxID=79078 RepID=A0ABU6YP80_9FABA|nr:hypothetical protein [Stylosanthes scabra]